MKPARPIIVLSLLSLLAVATAQAAEAPTSPATQSAPKAVSATRHLLVQTSGFAFPEDEFFIRLGEQAQKLGTERAGLKDRDLRDWFSASGHSGQLEISVAFNRAHGIMGQPVIAENPPPVAAEIADALVSFTRDYVTEMYDRQRQEALAGAERRLAAAAAPADEADTQLKRLRQQLRDLSGRSDVSQDTLTAALTAIDDQVQKLQLDRLAKESRREALQEEIARASERVQRSVESDAIAAELKKVVEAREQGVERMKQGFESGQTSQSELHEAITKAAEARAKMLQQQRDAAAAAGGAALESFNRELMTLSIDSREMEAKLKYLEERLPRLRAAVESLDDYRQAQDAAGLAAQELRHARTELQKVRIRLEELAPPRVLLKESSNERVEQP